MLTLYQESILDAGADDIQRGIVLDAVHDPRGGSLCGGVLPGTPGYT